MGISVNWIQASHAESLMDQISKPSCFLPSLSPIHPPDTELQLRGKTSWRLSPSSKLSTLSDSRKGDHRTCSPHNLRSKKSDILECALKRRDLASLKLIEVQRMWWKYAHICTTFNDCSSLIMMKRKDIICSEVACNQGIARAWSWQTGLVYFFPS